MSSNHTLLVADDEPNIRRVLEAMFSKDGFTVFTAENGKRAIEIASKNPVDVLISDLIMPDMTGVEVLRAVKLARPDCAAILITAFGTIKSAVEAMRLGAYNYITKPFDVDEVRLMVKKALEGRGSSEVAAPIGGTRSGYQTESIVGLNPSMQELYTLIKRAAGSKATVLIRGESGSGKELVARALHSNSPRAAKPFVPVNCAALSETLLESELFGHEKNAFTGAAAQKPGRFEMANGGTLFLDEIGEIPPAVQVKLLRVLQEREYERVGGTKSVRVDVRLVAATNKDLEKAVKEGEFREDLYYRLQVIQLAVPPLRERREDIRDLAEHFLRKYNAENGRKIKSISPEALELLVKYDFPGNVRELENAIERAVVLADASDSVITPDLLPAHIRQRPAA
jgi:DNA-binding NtrC family response regulator